MIEAGLSATSVYPSERIIFRNGTGTRLAASFDNQTKTVSVIITSTVSGLPITDATGAVDVITATYSTKLVLADKLLCAFVATGANATATPSFNPDGLGAKTIVKKGGQVLVAGDIPGALAVCILEYNLANTRWELLNPSSGATGANGVVPIVTATGTVDVITATYSPVLTLSNLVMCAIVTSGTNTTAVTFSPDGLTVHAIVYDGVALVAGQMPKVAMLEYDLPNTRWELLNPIATVSLTNVKKGSFGATWDGQGAVIGTGAWQEIIVPYAGTITDWVIDSYTPATGVVVSGSIIIELYRSGASIIGAGNKPTLAAASTNSAAVAGWTSTAVAAGDKLYAYVSSSPVSCLKVTCTFNITKT